MAIVNAEMGGVVPSGMTPIINIFTQDFTATFGPVASLVGSTFTQSVTGLLTTDSVMINCVSAVPSGMNIANVRVSASDTLELTIGTAVAIGITLGSLTWRVTILRAN